MDYKISLTEYKHILKQQLVYKEMLLKKYSLNGYISQKIIKGKAYEYYQYRTEDGELVSIRLTNDKRTLYESSLMRATRLRKNIEKIQDVLKFFSGVPDNNIEISQVLPIYMLRFKILDHAVGISPQYHIMFEIVAEPISGEYMISYTKNGKNYTVSMVHIDGTTINMIPEYIRSAGLIVDRAIGGSKATPTHGNTLLGVSPSGIKYAAIVNTNEYTARFKLFKKPCVKSGILPMLYDSEYKMLSYKLVIEKEIEETFWKEKIERFAKEFNNPPLK